MKELLIALGVLVGGALGITNANVEQAKDIEAKVVTTVILDDEYVKDWRIVKDEKTGFLVAKGNVFGNGEAKKRLDDTAIQVEFKTIDGDGEVATETIKVPVTLQVRDNVAVKLPVEKYDRVVIK
mgnify:CR=1 FL=1